MPFSSNPLGSGGGQGRFKEILLVTTSKASELSIMTYFNGMRMANDANSVQTAHAIVTLLTDMSCAEAVTSSSAHTQKWKDATMNFFADTGPLCAFDQWTDRPYSKLRTQASGCQSQPQRKKESQQRERRVNRNNVELNAGLQPAAPVVNRTATVTPLQLQICRQREKSLASRKQIAKELVGCSKVLLLLGLLPRSLYLIRAVLLQSDWFLDLLLLQQTLVEELEIKMKTLQMLLKHSVLVAILLWYTSKDHQQDTKIKSITLAKGHTQSCDAMMRLNTTVASLGSGREIANQAQALNSLASSAQVLIGLNITNQAAFSTILGTQMNHIQNAKADGLYARNNNRNGNSTGNGNGNENAATGNGNGNGNVTGI
ncbi:predicted protein [Chaetoceros tenuissimus]|uniref:Uncharacterized protein n=1 Tax=Chaetoceros tenuissimus TaxID=426638 RepID=A0AAD3H569_9STRA|nr:predicted protein [Chaetoceros tenuissimus]